MKKDYNVIEAIEIENDGTINYVNCNYDVLYRRYYSFSSYKFETWIECDKKGNIIYCKDSNGSEQINKYDENNHRIYHKYLQHNDNSDYSIEFWYNYDEQGNIIYIKDDNGTETRYEYTNNNNTIHMKSTTGNESWTDYNDNRTIMHQRTSNGYNTIQEHDNKGNIIYEKDVKGRESWYDYDNKGSMAHIKMLNKEIWYNNADYYKHIKCYNDIEEYWLDKNDEIIYYKDVYGNIHWEEYRKVTQ